MRVDGGDTMQWLWKGQRTRETRGRGPVERRVVPTEKEKEKERKKATDDAETFW